MTTPARPSIPLPAAVDTAAGAIDNIGNVIPGVDPSLTPAGKAITDVSTPLATGISALDVATNINNGKYVHAIFGTVDAPLSAIIVAKLGTAAAAGAGVLNVAGRTKAASSG